MKPGLPAHPCPCDACVIRREEEQAEIDHAAVAAQMARANYADIELRVLATHGLPDPHTTSMREEFALFYGGGTRTGRFSSQPSIANRPKKDTAT